MITLRRHFTGIVTLVLFATGAAGVAYSYTKATVEERGRETVRTSGAAPEALLEETEFDWGSIDRTTAVEQPFTLRNPSTTPLIVQSIATSCGCTTAQLLLSGTVVDLPAAIPPGGEGTVLVRFDPALHDARGETDRAVRIETNDPERPFLIINLSANVR